MEAIWLATQRNPQNDMDCHPVKKQPGFEASFDARAARACAAILLLELSLAVSFACEF